LVDWRALKKLTNPQAAGDLNAFLEKLPQRAGKTMLIMAGAAWALAGLSGLYTTIQMKKLTEVRATLQEAKALQPIVPVIKDAPVDQKEIAEFVDKITKIYDGLSIKVNGSAIVISADSTASFGQFREAVGHVQNGGSGWRVAVDRLCVGRECEQHPLGVSLKISKVSVEVPAEKI